MESKNKKKITFNESVEAIHDNDLSIVESLAEDEPDSSWRYEPGRVVRKCNIFKESIN